MMPIKRACVGESQVRNKLSNGPRRAKSKASDILPCPVFYDEMTCVSCRGYVGILLRA